MHSFLKLSITPSSARALTLFQIFSAVPQQQQASSQGIRLRVSIQSASILGQPAPTTSRSIARRHQAPTPRRREQPRGRQQPQEVQVRHVLDTVRRRLESDRPPHLVTYKSQLEQLVHTIAKQLRSNL